jgi:hypothetical protein
MKRVPETMPPGNSLVIDPVAGTDLWKLGENLENPIVTKQDSDSPLMRHVRLDNVVLPEAKQLTPIEGAKSLVTALSGDPLYFSSEQPGRKVLVLTVNLDQGDLTFRTAFPIMATNALAWFAGQSAELRESLASGSVTEISLPDQGPAASPLAIVTPTGQTRPLPSGLSKTVLGPLDACGLWSVTKLVTETSSSSAPLRSGGTRNVTVATPVIELACNLASRTETDLRVPENRLKSEPPTGFSATWFTRPIWFYLVSAAWLLAVVEWFLYQRRWIS